VQVAKGAIESGNANVADIFVFKPDFGLAVVANFEAKSSNHDGGSTASRKALSAC